MRLSLFVVCLLLGWGCKPKAVVPVSGLIGKVWQAQLVKEGATTVYTQGATGNVRPGYANFRLDLSTPGKVALTDIDGRTSVGTWTVSTDNRRLILENLVPKQSETIGTIEYYIVVPPTDAQLQVQRTAESRKTGNTVNDYTLIPLK